MAWQFNRPEIGEGVVQAFRRKGCIYASADLKLRGLDRNATYTIRDFDVEGSKKVSGRDLMEKGLLVEIPQPRGAAVVKYSRDPL